MASDMELREAALWLSEDDLSQLSRDDTKKYLRALEVTYDDKDNTPRLKTLLESAIQKIDTAGASGCVGTDGSRTSTLTSDPLFTIVQMLQQQMQQLEDRFRQEQDCCDQQFVAMFSAIGSGASIL